MLEELGALASLADGDHLIDCSCPTRTVERAHASGPVRADAHPALLLAHAQAVAARSALLEELGQAMAADAANGLAIAQELGRIAASLLARIGAARARPDDAPACELLADLDRHASRIDCLGRRLTSGLHGQLAQGRALVAQTAIATTATRTLVGQIEAGLPVP